MLTILISPGNVTSQTICLTLPGAAAAGSIPTCWESRGSWNPCFAQRFPSESR